MRHLVERIFGDSKYWEFSIVQRLIGNDPPLDLALDTPSVVDTGILTIATVLTGVAMRSRDADVVLDAIVCPPLVLRATLLAMLSGLSIKSIRKPPGTPQFYFIFILFLEIRSYANHAPCSLQ